MLLIKFLVFVVEFIIFSDSKSALSALENLNKNKCSPIIFTIRQKLALADSLDINIKLVWIPSHEGIDGNNKVDSKAKNATSEVTNLNELIPVFDLYSEVKKKCKKENENLINNLSKENRFFYFQNFFVNSNKPLFCFLKEKAW